jgi:phosphoglycerate dehydrogenase-like enzyme
VCAVRPLVTILDDYQHVALGSANWSAVGAAYDVVALDVHLANERAVLEQLRASEVVVAMRERTPFRASTLAGLANLRLLVTTGMANASIDLDAARAAGITVCGTTGSGNSMPELTLGMMIALARNFAAEDHAVRAGGWQHTIGPGLFARTLGIVGLGRLGTPVARLAQAFGMTVTAWSPHLTAARAEEVGVRAVSKEELFSRSDYITIHMPLVDATRGLIGREDLERMQPGAYLINTSRGPIVQEDALVSVLADRRIAGAGLDVYDVEPLPLDHPLRSMPNTLLLPHIGYVVKEGYERMYADAVEDILAFGAGSPVRVLT